MRKLKFSIQHSFRSLLLISGLGLSKIACLSTTATVLRAGRAQQLVSATILAVAILSMVCSFFMGQLALLTAIAFVIMSEP
jgi:hypothetical protein